jgi:transposase
MALASTQPHWAVGFEDEVWFSRLAQPGMSTWTGDTKPLRLCVKERAPQDETAKALACYGLLVPEQTGSPEQMLLRFVAGRPLSAVTIAFLSWACERLWEQGKRVLVLVWDNASWHLSREVRAWVKRHNRQVKTTGSGVRLLVCPLPSRSPWLNRIEPKWVQGKRALVEPQRVLSLEELAQRLCRYYGCQQLEPLSQKLC